MGGRSPGPSPPEAMYQKGLTGRPGELGLTMSTPTRKRARAPVVLAFVALVTTGLLGLPTVAATAPVNDDFDDATVVDPLPFMDMVQTGDATVETTDPSCGSFGKRRTVWYNYTATVDTFIEIDTNGSTYSTVIGLFTENPFNGLISHGCVLDTVGGSVTKVRINVPAGTTLFIMVGAGADTPLGGKLVFNVRETLEPLVLDVKIDGAKILSGSKATLFGTATLSRKVPGPGTLCVTGQLQQYGGWFPNAGAGTRCISGIDNKTSIPWSVTVVGARPWKAGYASAFVSGQFYAPNESATDTSSKTVKL